MKLKRLAAGATVAAALGLTAIGLGAGVANAAPPVTAGPAAQAAPVSWHGAIAVDDWHGRWHNAPWGNGRPPWGWGPPPPPAWVGPLPPPGGPPPGPINYWGYTVQPVWDAGFNQWGFWLGGVWIPL